MSHALSNPWTPGGNFVLPRRSRSPPFGSTEGRAENDLIISTSYLKAASGRKGKVFLLSDLTPCSTSTVANTSSSKHSTSIFSKSIGIPEPHKTSRQGHDEKKTCSMKVFLRGLIM
jgi:hypothetical protein